MKKFIVYLMLLSNLFSGVAFAWDTHFEVAASHNATKIVSSSDIDDSNNDRQHNDHCAHASAYLVGVFGHYKVALSPSQNGQLQNNFSVSSFPPLYIPPLLRPPIV